MADEADLAFEAEQRAIDSAIAVHSKATSRYRPVGMCHYCEDTVSAVQLFCNQDCSEDQARLDLLQRNAGTYGFAPAYAVGAAPWGASAA